MKKNRPSLPPSLHIFQSMSSFTSKELAGVGKAGSIAEESLMGVRTVQAFNGQEEMVEK